ncbi:MAG: cytochrome P450 [Deltaproteobacteria bacterium]|nr:MAG: cytochrome P450 [Deltaproteobacteria bacterium]
MSETLTQTQATSNIAPGPPWYHAFRTVRRIRQDMIQFLTESTEAYGDVARYRFGPIVLHFFRHPDHVQHILQARHRNFCRSSFYDQMKRLLGEGLLTSDGDFWLKQRRLIQPAFHRKRLDTLAWIMAEEADTLVQRWQRHAGGEPFDIVEDMMRFALLVAGRSLFETNVEEKADLIGEALTFAQAAFNERVNSLVPWPEWTPLPRFRKYRWAIATLDQIVRELVQERRQDSETHHDLLAMLMELRDADTGEGMSDEQIRDEVMTLLLAGHETTGNQLSWTLSLLSQHPEVADRVADEAQRVLGDRAPTSEDLPSLVYTKQVLQESMRLFPPAWIMDRAVVDDDNIGGFVVPKKSVVVISPYMTHRHPDFWDDPEAFDPERFAPERAKGRHRYAYFPFGGGPRQCIGNHFAMMETQIALALLCRAFRFQLKPGHPIEKEMLITLRPKHGIQLSLSPRTSFVA